MNLSEYTIQEIIQVVPEVFKIHLTPQSGSSLSFTAGQFVGVANPTYVRPAEMHYFSIASTTSDPYIELCIRVYGNWTQAFSKLTVGSVVKLSAPMGNFTLPKTVGNVVFLAGGVGIVPFVSMLRSNPRNQNVTLIYGSRTQDTIVYKDELQRLKTQLPTLKIIDVLSDEPSNSTWQGYRGFFTREILEKEINLNSNPTFFLCGPPIFVSSMQKLLTELNIPKDHIKQELFSGSGK